MTTTTTPEGTRHALLRHDPRNADRSAPMTADLCSDCEESPAIVTGYDPANGPFNLCARCLAECDEFAEVSGFNMAGAR